MLTSLLVALALALAPAAPATAPVVALQPVAAPAALLPATDSATDPVPDCEVLLGQINALTADVGAKGAEVDAKRAEIERVTELKMENNCAPGSSGPLCDYLQEKFLEFVAEYGVLLGELQQLQFQLQEKLLLYALYCGGN